MIENKIYYKNEDLNKLKKQKDEQKEEINNLNKAMSNQLAKHQMLMVAIFNEMDNKQRSNIFNIKKIA